MIDYTDVINTIAEENNTSFLVVYRDIEAAILEAKNDPDPKKRKAFAKIPCAGEIPTPQEFLKYLANRTKAAQKHPKRRKH